ncbi:CBS domain-containing protein [Myxococcota bacterium]|nr:CBS domain-containing protein [Myxococcota bacterium]MCZ7616946.1 CBS domain-containing protein [Myxococcota bacterium]
MHTLEQVLRNRHLVTAGPEEAVLEVLRRMTEARVGAIVVLAGDRLVGIFSERDLMTRVVVPGIDPATTKVEAVMTRQVVTADLRDTRDASLRKMQSLGCRHLPVLADGRVLAMLSMRDLLRDEIQEQSEEIQHLRAYVYQTPPVNS